MKNYKKYMIGISAGLTSLVFTGCCCTTATLSEAWYASTTNDPSSVAIVQPNDTQLDPMAQHVQEKKNDWIVTASVIPSEEAAVSLASIGGSSYGVNQTRQFFTALGQDVAHRFGALKNFKIVGAPVTDPSGVTEVQSAAPNRLTYNLSQLSCKFHRGEYHPAVWYNGHRIRDAYTDPDYFAATASVHVSLLDASGNQRFSITAAATAKGDTEANAANLAIKAALNDVMLQYGMRYAPPAHVTMMRGDGLFAKINIGQKDGVVAGTPVRFVQFVNLGQVGGKDNIQENVIATGNVCKLESDSAWVKINCYHYKVVHIGTLARLGR